MPPVSLLLVLVGTSFLLHFGPLLRHVAAEEFKFRQHKKSKSRRDWDDLLIRGTAAEEKRNSLSQRELRKNNLFDRSRSKKTPEGPTSRHKKNDSSRGKMGGGKKRGKTGKKGTAKGSSKSAKGSKKHGKSTKGSKKRSKSTKGSKKHTKIPKRTSCPSPKPTNVFAMPNPTIESAVKDIESAAEDIESAINDIVFAMKEPTSCSRDEERKCCRDICDGDYMTHFCKDPRCVPDECRKFFTTCSGRCPLFKCNCEYPFTSQCSFLGGKCPGHTKQKCCLAQCFGLPPFLESSSDPGSLGASANASEYCKRLTCGTKKCPSCPS